MTVINFDRPSPALGAALQRFYHARLDFARLMRDDGSSGRDLFAVAVEITHAEEDLFHAIEKMRVEQAP